MLFPALHDLGGWAAAEGMAAGLPLICLNLGGPATQVTAESGFKIPAQDPDQASRDIAAAMINLARDGDMWRRLCRGARERAVEEFSWTSKAKRFDHLYNEVVTGMQPLPTIVSERIFYTRRSK